MPRKKVVKRTPKKAVNKYVNKGSSSMLSRGLKESLLFLFSAMGIFLIISLYSYSPTDPAWSHTITASEQAETQNLGGVIGSNFADISYYLLGYMAYLIPIMIVIIGWVLYKTNSVNREGANRKASNTQKVNKSSSENLYSWNFSLRIFGFILTIVSGCALATMHFLDPFILFPSDIGSGGILGEVVSDQLKIWFSLVGSTLILLTLFIVGITFFSHLSWLWLMDTIGKWAVNSLRFIFVSTIATVQFIFKWVKGNLPTSGGISSSETSKPITISRFDSSLDEEDKKVEGANEGTQKDSLTTKILKHSSSIKSQFTTQLKKFSSTATQFDKGNNLIEEPSDLSSDALLDNLSGNDVDNMIEAEIPADIDASRLFLKNQSSNKQSSKNQKIEPIFDKTLNSPNQDPLVDIKFSTGIVPVDEEEPSASKPPSASKQPLAQKLINSVTENFQSLNQSFSREKKIDKQDDVEKSTLAESIDDRAGINEAIANQDIATQVTTHVTERQPRQIQTADNPIKVSARSNLESQKLLFKHDELDTLPALSLLDPPRPSTDMTSAEELERLSRTIEENLADYRMSVEVVAVQQGPVITRFELELAPGIKVSQLSNLSKDLARALLVVSIRVVEVIAGKSTVGIEIPNEYREIVSFYEVLNSAAYGDSKALLPLGLGTDISGQPVVADLAKMPHLLVAGTTGSGKSVGVNSMILSLLFHLNPDELRLIMVDPKMLELSIYEGIPHLLCPVVTDMMEAANALRWCVAEMERRYKLMSALGVRNIAGYNKKVKAASDAGEPIMDPLFEPNPMMASLRPDELDTLPYIVIVIDEFADMMMIVGKKVEELIARLAQKARAAGLHLIIATQRPSVNVITGLIKANVPTRIAFQVSSKIDSRTILDQMGAEALLGNGDMLFLPPGTGTPQRVHGAFVSDEEVHKVVDALKERGEAEYIDEILSGDGVEPVAGIAGESSENELDPLYDQAVAIVVETRRASISGIQRRLKVGYNRAARMVEDMEAAGLVSSVQSNGQREVLSPQQ